MVIITGGSSGIGASLARALATRNQKVLIVGRRQSLLEKTALFSPLIDFCVADISTLTGRKALVAYLKPTHQLTALVHNAGIIEPIMPLSEIDENSWHHILETNLNAPLFLSQALFSKLKGGRVLHIGSGAAHFPVQGWGGYCVSKAALSMLTACWQLESKSVAFASVMPGIVDTDMQAVIRESKTMATEKRDFFKRLKQENKLLSKEAVASFLTWLLLDVPVDEYCSREWDIYATADYSNWVNPPFQLPTID